MPSHGMHGGSKTHHLHNHAGHVKREPDKGSSPPASQRRVLSMDRRKGPADKDLEGLISSAMLAADKELANVVREVDEVAKALRSGATDAKEVRSAVHPAVWYAVRHVILERELRNLALTDDLTCLYNRRGFFAAATQQLKLARRNANSALLFFCDVDNLRSVNDSFGAREGDRALVRTADVLEEVFRDSDILARLGGNEFGVLALDASSRNEQTILDRIAKKLRKANEEEPQYALSLSIGVARFDPLGGGNLGDLMMQADQAVYEKKRSKPRLFSKHG